MDEETIQLNSKKTKQADLKMGKRPRNGQQVCAKVASVTNHQRDAKKKA
jgi:hypothetical protein